MIRAALIIIGIILIIWFIIPYISGSILNIGNVTGTIVGAVILLYGIFFTHINKFISWFWQRWYGKVIEIIIACAIAAIIILAILCMISMAGGMKQTVVMPDREDGYIIEKGNGELKEKTYEVAEGISKNSDNFVSDTGDVNKDDTAAAEKNKTVIVLGCKIREYRPSLMLEERLDAAYEYLTEYPGAKVIVSGGQGEDEITTEASVMSDWLLNKGIAADRIIMEERSTDTHENLRFSYEIINKSNGDLSKDVVLVTNEFHEYRALKIAKETGFNAYALPAKTAWWLFPTYYVREMYGILQDWFLMK